MRRNVFTVVVMLLGLTTLVMAQEAGPMGVVSPAKSKFANLPGLPACMTVAVLHGDPTKGPSTLLLNFTAGCAVPWHWHMANESLVLVSGTGEAQMKDGQPMAMKAGDFLFLPGEGIHRFSAKSAVYLYDMPDGAFDIHYVDAEGKEIPPEKALASQIKIRPAAGPTTTH
jgi:quercetin dioxygenase-like cupin family protein